MPVGIADVFGFYTVISSFVHQWITSIINDHAESCHGKMCHKIFVVVIPKEGLASILLLVWHWPQNIICEGSRVQFYSRCHIQRRNGAPCQSFFGYDNDKNLKAYFPMTQLVLWFANPVCLHFNTKLNQCESKSNCQNVILCQAFNHIRFPREAVMSCYWTVSFALNICQFIWDFTCWPGNLSQDLIND